MLESDSIPHEQQKFPSNSWRGSLAHGENKPTKSLCQEFQFAHVLRVFPSTVLLLQLQSASISAVTCKSVSEDLMRRRFACLCLRSDKIRLSSFPLIAGSLGELQRSAMLQCHFTDIMRRSYWHPTYTPCSRHASWIKALAYRGEVNSTWWKPSSWLLVSALWRKGDLPRVDSLSLDNELSDAGGPIPTLSHSGLVHSLLRRWNYAIFGISSCSYLH